MSTPQQEALEQALRTNETRYASYEIDLTEYQAGIDTARRQYRIATGQATDWKAVADDMYDLAVTLDETGYYTSKEAWNRAVAEHTEKP